MIDTALAISFVIIVGLSLCAFLEAWAAARWSKWAFRGVRIRPALEIDLNPGVSASQVAQAISANPDYSELGLVAKDVSEDRLFVILYLDQRQRHDSFLKEFGSPFTATGKLDRQRGCLMLSLRLGYGFTVFIASAIILICWRAAAAGHAASALFAIIGFPAFFLGIYLVQFRVRLNNLAYLLSQEVADASEEEGSR